MEASQIQTATLTKQHWQTFPPGALMSVFYNRWFTCVDALLQCNRECAYLTGVASSSSSCCRCTCLTRLNTDGLPGHQTSELHSFLQSAQKPLAKPLNDLLIHQCKLVCRVSKRSKTKTRRAQNACAEFKKLAHQVLDYGLRMESRF